MRACVLACSVALTALSACSKQTSDGTTTAVAAGSASTAPSRASNAGDAPVAPAGHADRLPPPDVAPVVRDGVAYAQADDGRKAGLAQINGVLLASDAASGKLLWALAVYPADIDPKQEADVQWVFFRSMAFDAGGRLRIVNEAGKAFLVDVKGRTVEPAP